MCVTSVCRKGRGVDVGVPGAGVCVVITYNRPQMQGSSGPKTMH